MKEITGSFSSAKIFTDVVEENAIEQIQTLCNQPFTEGCRIRVMPDAHSGKGCVIGFTSNLSEKLVPNIVGVDIGCGMLTVKLGDLEIDYQILDNIIRTYIPCGQRVHEGRIVRYPKLQSLHCYRNLKDTKRIERSLGSLGGGNHFIEIDADESGAKYLVIHSGSRNLGHQVAEHYQHLAYELMQGKDELFAKQQQIIDEYKAAGRKSEIQEAIRELHRSFTAKGVDTPRELAWLFGEYRQMYLDDMAISQDYAALNRKTIAEIILTKMFDRSFDEFDSFETVHNYIDIESGIVRKGAVSAREGEMLLIPINMRDGSLICCGKGNPDWNYSAPHGAGRLFSRNTARERFTVEEFSAAMDGIFTTSVGEGTLDECPMAYKSMNDIVDNIEPTAEIISTIKPKYNFKAGM